MTIIVLCDEQPHVWDQQCISNRKVCSGGQKKLLKLFLSPVAWFGHPVMQGNERTEKITFAQDKSFSEAYFTLAMIEKHLTTTEFNI